MGDEETVRSIGGSVGRTTSRRISQTLSHPLTRTDTARESIVSDVREERYLASRVSSENILKEKEYTGPLPLMGGDKDYPPGLPDREQYRVDFDGPDDPYMPYNWVWWRKLIFMLTVQPKFMCVVMTSSAVSPVIPFLEEEFHLGTTPAALGLSLYLMGFAIGPVLWGPLTEVYGRKLPNLVSFTAMTCLVWGTATAENVWTFMLCRFFSGVAGAGTFATVPAGIADVFNTYYRGYPVAIFCGASFGGPMVTPVFAGYIAYSFLGPRWVFYIMGIFSGACDLSYLLFGEETYPESLLINKAKELRERTGNWGIYAHQETLELDIKEIVVNTIGRPLYMLVTEPIVLLMSIYNGYVYGILYMCMEAMPIIFEGYGWTGGKLYLPYAALTAGCICSFLTAIVWWEPQYQKALLSHNMVIVPEDRLPSTMVAGIVFPIGIFLMCWSGAYAQECHWAVPCVGAGLLGYGMYSIFQQVTNYMIDAYLEYAASSTAANAFVRAAMAAAFPLFSTQMYNNLGVQWAGTLVGCLGVLVAPIPFVFYYYGRSIRRWSRFAGISEAEEALYRDKEE